MLERVVSHRLTPTAGQTSNTPNPTDMKHRCFALYISTALLTAAFAATAPSAEIRQDNREIREDNRDVRHDRQEIRQDARQGDAKEVKQDVKELRKDKKERRKDRKERRKDLKKANQTP